jgi:DNA-binding transcriptional LysR family regulator
MPTRTASAIDLRLLRQFVAVAEELHFHHAARRLAMSQPPLTAAMRRLEAEVGTTLIQRGNRTVALTAAGEALLGEARARLVHADRAVMLVRDAALRVGQELVSGTGAVGSSSQPTR